MSGTSGATAHAQRGDVRDAVGHFRVACTACGRVPQGFAPFCPACGAMCDVEYDLTRVRLRESSDPYVRFADLLPVRDPSRLPPSSFTPARHAVRLGEALGLPRLYLKDETGLPTGTTKDRMAAVALAYLAECGVTGFCTSSTGNSSTAYAHAIGRFPDLRLYLFTAADFVDRVHVPDGRQVVHFVLRGATFVEAFEAARAYANRHGLVAERGFFNPGRREGLKTAWLEAVDQVPGPIDWYVQAVSSAMGVYGTYQAARQLRALGRTDRLPRLLCVQQDTCAPMVAAWRDGSERIRAEHVVARPTGIARAVLRGDPSATYPHIRRIVLESGGTFVDVSEAEIRAAHDRLGELEGIDACFASAAALAGLIKAVAHGNVPRTDTILVNLTGRERQWSDSRQTRHWLKRDGSGWTPEDPSDAYTRELWERP